MSEYDTAMGGWVGVGRLDLVKNIYTSARLIYSTKKVGWVEVGRLDLVKNIYLRSVQHSSPYIKIYTQNINYHHHHLLIYFLRKYIHYVVVVVVYILLYKNICDDLS